VGDEFETYGSFKCKIEEIPAYSVKLLIRKLVTIWISGNSFHFTLNTFISFKLIAHRDCHDVPCAVLRIARYCWVIHDGPAYNISLLLMFVPVVLRARPAREVPAHLAAQAPMLQAVQPDESQPILRWCYKVRTDLVDIWRTATTMTSRRSYLHMETRQTAQLSTVETMNTLQCQDRITGDIRVMSGI